MVGSLVVMNVIKKKQHPKVVFSPKLYADQNSHSEGCIKISLEQVKGLSEARVIHEWNLLSSDPEDNSTGWKYQIHLRTIPTDWLSSELYRSLLSPSPRHPVPLLGWQRVLPCRVFTGCCSSELSPHVCGASTLPTHLVRVTQDRGLKDIIYYYNKPTKK